MKLQLLPLPGFEPRTSRLAGHWFNHRFNHTIASIQEKFYLHLPLPGFELGPHAKAVLTMILL
jgi:hypothetical protein